MTDSVESRLGRLEREMSAMTQRVGDMGDDVKDCRTQMNYIAEVRFQMQAVHGEISQLRMMIEHERTERAKDRQERTLEREERAANSWKLKVAFISGIFLVFSTSITAAATVFGA